MIQLLVAEVLGKCLMEAEFPNVFPKVSVSTVECEEPIVLFQGGFERESRIDGEERGRVPVTIYVVRELAADAEADANAAEACLRHADWERFSPSGPWRVVGIDTTAPAFEEIDSSGRYVWCFDASVTAAREI